MNKPNTLVTKVVPVFIWKVAPVPTNTLPGFINAILPQLASVASIETDVPAPICMVWEVLNIWSKGSVSPRAVPIPPPPPPATLISTVLVEESYTSVLPAPTKLRVLISEAIESPAELIPIL